MNLSFQHLLELARKGGPDMTLRRKHFPPTYDSEERDRRTHRRYLKILREVKEECGDTALSSDEEGNALGWTKGFRCEWKRTHFWCKDRASDKRSDFGLYFHWLWSNEHMVIVTQIGDGSCRSKFISVLDLISWPPSSPARCSSPPVPLRVIPTLSTLDMKTSGENQTRGQYG